MKAASGGGFGTVCLAGIEGTGSYGAGLARHIAAAAGDHPERLRSEAAWAHLCATAPLSASSGKVTRYRLNPGGDRQANHALYRIVITRLSSHPPARAYAGRRTKEGLPDKEMTQHHRQPHLPGPHRQVGVTDPGPGAAHHDLVISRFLQIQLL